MRRIIWCALALFCLLESSAWVLPPIPESTRIGLYSLVSLIALAAGARKPAGPPRSILQLGLASLMLLGFPALLTRWASGHSSVDTETLVFALSPVFTAIVMAQFSTGGEPAPELIGPGLLGLGGLLLLVPFNLPHTATSQLALVAYMLAAIFVAVTAVWIHRLLQGFDAWQGFVVICLTNAAFLSVVSAFDQDLRFHWNSLSPQAAPAVGVALLELLLLIWLLRVVPPIRFAGRFLLTPLLIIIEGYVVLRPELTPRMLSGLGVLTVGTVWILSSNLQKGAPSLSLR
jgi:drug/metabolite transporter (DMT)-like permease